MWKLDTMMYVTMQQFSLTLSIFLNHHLYLFTLKNQHQTEGFHEFFFFENPEA